MIILSGFWKLKVPVKADSRQWFDSEMLIEKIQIYRKLPNHGRFSASFVGIRLDNSVGLVLPKNSDLYLANK